MKKVKDTKAPTIRQLQNISENLKEHFKAYVSISIKTYSYLSGHDSIEYRIYISNSFGSGEAYQFDTWPKFLQCYHELMKKENL